MPLLKNSTIISRLQKGDRSAFEEVYREHHKALYGMALRYLKDHELAEDAVHDVLINLWNSRKKLNSSKSIRGFLFTALRNRVLNIIKMNSRRILRQFDYASLNSAEEVQADDLMYHKELREIIETGLEKLPPGKRNIFRLKKLEGYSNAEIAQKLGITKHTVNSQLYKANEFLKKFVDEQSEQIYSSENNVG